MQYSDFRVVGAYNHSSFTGQSVKWHGHDEHDETVEYGGQNTQTSC